jgi:hypothetical protein
MCAASHAVVQFTKPEISQVREAVPDYATVPKSGIMIRLSSEFAAVRSELRESATLTSNIVGKPSPGVFPKSSLAEGRSVL